MDRTFVIWKRIFYIRRSKVPVSETNYQVSIQTFKLALLSNFLLDKDIVPEL
uniref:Esterase/lipase superfamily protein n=1 Tax=Solanum tuberosum TaxID=4113 RepID=M1ABP1_SOLTU